LFVSLLSPPRPSGNDSNVPLPAGAHLSFLYSLRRAVLGGGGGGLDKMQTGLIDFHEVSHGLPPVYMFKN
jgi:hypothetical protein